MKMASILIVVIIICITNTIAQENAKPGFISGKVTDSETLQPLPGVTIKVLDTKFGAITKSDGTYIIENVPAGRYSVNAYMPGYKPHVQSDVAVVPLRSSYCNFELDVSQYESGEITIKPDLFENGNISEITAVTSIDYEEIRMTPGIPDVFRRLQSVAGVGGTNESSAAMIVRGGDPEENLTLIENIEIFSPYHFASLGGDNTGGLSIIDPRLVSNVTMSTGGFPALYGDRLSSVTLITMREPEKQRINGDISFDMGGLTAFFSGPLTSNTSWMISGRRGVMDLIMKLVDMDFTPRTLDLHTKFIYEPSASHRISFYGLYSQDEITGSAEEEDNFGKLYYSNMIKNQYAAGINWRWLYSDKGYLLVTPYINMSDWKLKSGVESNKEGFGNENREGHTGIKAEAFYRLDEVNRFSFGGEFRNISARYRKWADYDTLSTGVVDLPYSLTFNPDNTFKYSAFVQYIFSPLPWTTFNIGLRDDYFGFTKESILSPRLSANINAGENLNFNLAWGLYAQFPQFFRIFYYPDNHNLKTSKAIHYIAGIEYLLSEDIQLKAEGFYKNLYDLAVTEGDTGKVYKSTGSGYSTGIELTLTQKMSENLYILVNYSYSVSKRRDAPGGELYFSRFDRPHNANIMATYKLGDWWEFGLSCSYAMGMPYTPYDLSTRRQIDGIWYADYGKKNSARFSDYFRVDARVDRRFIFDSWNLRAYFEIWNLTNHENAFEYKYSKDFLTIKKDVLFPFTPMIGIAAEF